MFKITKFICLLALLTLSQIYAQVNEKFKEPDTKTNIAVLQLDNNGITISEAKALTDRLRMEIFRHNKYNVMERQKMDDILNEMKFQVSGCTSDECAIEIGRMIGVSKMVAGSVSKVGEYYTVSARIIDMETGRIETTAVEDIQGTLGMVLTRAIPSVSRQLCGLSTPDYKVKNEPEKLTKLKVYSAPSGAMVYLNNIYKGITPLTLEILPQKRHSLKITKENYQEHNQSFTINSGETKEISIVLSRSYTKTVRNEEKKSTPPQQRYNQNKKLFRLSLIAMDEPKGLNNFINDIHQKINAEHFQLFEDRINYVAQQKMETFAGLAITSGQGLSNYFFFNFDFGVLFSIYDNDDLLDLMDLDFFMPFASLDITFHPLGNSFLNPYLLVGYGYNFLIMKAVYNDEKVGGVNYQSWGLTYGGGLEFRIANSFGVGLEWNKRDMKMELTSMGDDAERFNAADLNKFKTEDNFIKINLNFYHN